MSEQMGAPVQLCHLMSSRSYHLTRRDYVDGLVDSTGQVLDAKNLELGQEDQPVQYAAELVRLDTSTSMYRFELSCCSSHKKLRRTYYKCQII